MEQNAEIDLSNDNNNNNNNNNFTIRLSVSKQTIAAKDRAGMINQFDERELNSTDIESLKEVLKSRNYSTNVWNGTRHGSTYVGMTGVALDFDSGMTISEAMNVFAPFNYILHTSTSHNVEKWGIVAERFRVILPFAPSDLRFVSSRDCKKVYLKLLSEFPQMDSACTDAARQFFPFCAERGAKFELYVNETGKYFDIAIDDVRDEDVRSDYPEHVWDGTLKPRSELDRILKFCPFVKWMKDNIVNPDTEMHEPLRFGFISNLCGYEGGAEEIHKVLSRDCRPGKYTRELVDDKIQRNCEEYNPQTYARLKYLGWPGPVPSKPLAPAGWGKIGTKTVQSPEYVRIGWEDNIVVKINGQWTVVNLEEAKYTLLPRHKTICAVCPVCSDVTATLKSDTFNFVHIWCEKCQKPYYEAALSPGMFTYKNKLLRVEKRSDQFISMEVLDEESFRDKADYTYVKRKLLTDLNRRFLDDQFQIRRIGSADFEQLDYEFRMQENALVFKYPALPVVATDNALIDNFLDTMFGKYSGFSKDWLAMYSYTNYLTLPVIILTSERSSGKGTFVDMVSSIFPRLAGSWVGVNETFNDQFKGKLIFVDENSNGDKPMQYTEIKKITGNKVIRINEKYTPAYYVPNNANIIIATNDPRPIFLKSREKPKSENVNNFFIYGVPEVDAKKIDKELGAKLQARLGHYIRTELKQRYDRLCSENLSNNRYTLAAPMTDLARMLFESAKTIIELETEELAEILVCGVDDPDPFNPFGRIQFSAKESPGKRYVQLSEIRELIGKLRFKGSSNPKAYVNVLQEQGVLSHDGSHREKSQRLGYLILRDKGFYADPDDTGKTGGTGSEMPKPKPSAFD